MEVDKIEMCRNSDQTGDSGDVEIAVGLAGYSIDHID